MNTEDPQVPTPPWRNKSNTSTDPTGQSKAPDQELSGLEAFFNRPGSAWAPIGVGFAGGFGAAALFLIFVSVITKVRTMEDSYLWSIYGGVALLGLILWSWFLSRVRIYRSQAQDPDFSSYQKKGKKRKGREQVEDEEEPDEDEKPWI
ncbi:MAG: hypothetical protein P8J45_04585 [Phycisphaerales bacterium]|nr:hypothetical protein [Phycisphaerales bacterium]